MFPRDETASSTFVLRLLREIEAQKNPGRDMEVTAKDAVEIVLHSIRNLPTILRNYSANAKKKEGASMDFGLFVPPKLVGKFIASKEERETRNWNGALNNARELERQGFPVLSGLGGEKGARNYITANLALNDLSSAVAGFPSVIAKPALPR